VVLAEKMFLSRSQFYRKMKAITDMGPREFIRKSRLQRAAQLIKLKRYTFSEITFLCGFSDTDYFRKCFKTEFGITPTAYKKQQDEA
ncbi:MAG: helix-turn-helix transcriptional regulator, partial [Bacteroidota bacterium]